MGVSRPPKSIAHLIWLSRQVLPVCYLLEKSRFLGVEREALPRRLRPAHVGLGEPVEHGSHDWAVRRLRLPPF